MADMDVDGRTRPALSPDYPDRRPCAVIYLFPRRVRVRPVEDTRCTLTEEIAATAAEAIPLRVFHGTGKVVSRAITTLAGHRITRLGDLAARTAVELAGLPGIGPRVLRHLDELLTRHGLGFRGRFERDGGDTDISGGLQQ
jgi:hypothetical protein